MEKHVEENKKSHISLSVPRDDYLHFGIFSSILVSMYLFISASFIKSKRS